MNWIIYFTLAFLISSFLSFIISKIAESKSKKKYLHRLGGAAIATSFVLVVATNPEIVLTQKITAILIASVLAAIFGAGDDRFDFSWKTQLVFQLLIGFLLIFFGFEINLISFAGSEILRLDGLSFEILGRTVSLISAGLILVWTVSIINAVNWLDGTDGLLSVTSIMALLAIFFVSLRPEVNQPALGILSLIGIGSFLGFFIFNFPPDKIIAGTGGSYFAGILLASLAIIAGTKIATTMIILILPVIDFIWVSLERIKKGKSIFLKEEKKTHLHYKLLNSGWSERRILLVYCLFLGSALLASFFVVNQVHKLLLLIIEFLMISLFIFSLTRRNSDCPGKQIIKNKKIVIGLLFLVVAGVVFCSGKFCEEQKITPEAIIIFNEASFEVEIADTPWERYQGLSGISSVGGNDGMLFIHPEKGSYDYVMREMKFDLDFVFIDGNEVVGLEKEVAADFSGKIRGEKKYDKVLELKAGEAQKNGIEAGDRIEIETMRGGK